MAFTKLLTKYESGWESTEDKDLLKKISERGYEPREAEAAFNEFHRRYIPYVWKVCYNACKHFQEPDQLAKDLAQEVMFEVYESASTFDPTHGQAKAWLGRIARNKFIDLFKKYRIDLTKISDEDLSEGKDNKNKFKFQSHGLAFARYSEADVEAALNLLSDRDRHILMTYMLYYDLENPDRHLPDVEMDKLCEEYETNPDNIRKIKSRAIKRVESSLKGK